MIYDCDLLCLMPLSAIFQLYHGDQFTKRVHLTRSRSDKVYQLLAHGWWFYLGTPASSTLKTGHHDIAEILLKVALNTINHNHKSSSMYGCRENF
jgi:hypothetical protein